MSVKWIALAFVSLLSSSARAEWIMLSDLAAKKASTSFECGQRVYVYSASLPPLVKGKHVLRAAWRRPSGALQDSTLYTFQAPVKELWMWFELDHRPGLLGVNGASDLYGKWSVLLELDGEEVGRKQFRLAC